MDVSWVGYYQSRSSIVARTVATPSDKSAKTIPEQTLGAGDWPPAFLAMNLPFF
jgi:hypothetical protein